VARPHPAKPACSVQASAGRGPAAQRRVGLAAWPVRLGRPTARQDAARAPHGVRSGACSMNSRGGTTGGGVARHRRSRGFLGEHLRTTSNALSKAKRPTSPREMTTVGRGSLLAVLRCFDEGGRCGGPTGFRWGPT
jgi:hypothetical protein